MSRSLRLGFAAIGLALVAFPLALVKPGLPPTLKADEPAYYLMALSLARDGDLRCEPRDLERLFQEFPYQNTRNLILMTDDGWASAYFGKPYIYSLLAAPAAALFGANGMVAVNMGLLIAMIAMGTSYLSRFNSEVVAALFSAGFFTLANGAAYVFWLHPEIFNMAAVTACLYLGLHPSAAARAPRRGLLRWAAALGSPALRPLWSGAALALAVYNKPVLAALGLPVLYVYLRGRRWRAVGVWLLGAVAASALLAGLAIAWTGHPSAYLGVERAGLSISSPDRLPVAPRAIAAGEKPTQRNSWWWIFRWPQGSWRRTLEDAGYFLWGRHTGLIPYMPFAVVALLLFLLHGRRASERWVLLGSLAAVALFFLLFIPFNWHGGGGFIGNRYFVNAYPAFLFLVTRIAPVGLLPVAYLVGGLLIGPILATPFGAPVTHPTLQAHVRNAPFRLFPLELSLARQIPGYRGASQGGLWFWGRKDQFLPSGDEMWLLGGQRVEVWATSFEPVSALSVRVRNVAPGNRLTIRFGADRKRLSFAPASLDPEGESRILELDPHRPDRVRDQWGKTVYAYRLLVEPERGRVVTRAAGEENGFLLGAALSFLGTSEELARDLYTLAWGACEAPAQVIAGADFQVTTRLRNRSQGSWPARGSTAVHLAYHWLTLEGKVVAWEGRRTDLLRDVASGTGIAQTVWVDAPQEPGRYLLELDPVREQVAWFSSRNGGNTVRMPVEVVPAAAGDSQVLAPTAVEPEETKGR